MFHHSAANQDATVGPLASVSKALHPQLGAGRIDPFGVFKEKGLHQFVHQIMDYALHGAAVEYLPSDVPSDVIAARRTLCQHMVGDSLIWYVTMLGAMSHYAFYSGATVLPQGQKLICLSYRSKVLSLLREDVAQHGGIPSNTGLLAMCGLIVYGSDNLRVKKSSNDPYNARKAFARANDMDYYGSGHLDAAHWPLLCAFVNQVNLPGNADLSTWMAVCFTTLDAYISWQALREPAIRPLRSTSSWLSMARHLPDSTASRQSARLLSGIPSHLIQSTDPPFSTLWQVLQHARTIVVNYNQYQRRYSQRSTRPDVSQINFARLLLMNDLLRLPRLSSDGHAHNITYETIRHTLMGFMQLVLFPITRSNEMPRRILEMAVPVLRQAKSQIVNGASTQTYQSNTMQQQSTSQQETLDRGVLLWCWMVAGMLATEHLETQGSHVWMDDLISFVDIIAVKPERSAWPMVKDMMESFLWLDSECDKVGQQWWDYVCLPADARMQEKRYALYNFPRNTRPDRTAELGHSV